MDYSLKKKSRFFNFHILPILLLGGFFLIVCRKIDTANILILCAVSLVIIIISWLSGKEVTESLNQAQESEEIAVKMAKNLEVEVNERTRELREAQIQELMKINCLAEFGKISAGLLHDIKNPLMVISMNLESLKTESKKDLESHKQELSQLINKSLLASKTIENVIKSSQKQLLFEDTKEEVNLNQEIKDTLELLTHRAKQSQVKLIFHPKQKIIIHCYPAKLSRVIANLVMNSIDSFENITRENRFVKISTISKLKNIQIIVEDNGCGIKESYKKYIFQPLFSTKKNNKNRSGLGLNISQKTIQDYFKGKLTFESTYGKGSKLIITLPKI